MAGDFYSPALPVPSLREGAPERTGLILAPKGAAVARINGLHAVDHTVNVPPMSMLTIAFDAGAVASWMLHCHHMGHLQSGMMTELAILS